MRITLSGAQSTGKTTLFNILKNDKMFKEYNCLSEITRNVKNKGFEINENGNDLTQLFIINSHLDRFFSSNKLLLDRSILDGIVYTKYLYDIGNVEEWVVEYALNVFEILNNKYTIQFYIEPEIGIDNDGVRSTNKEFRSEIIKNFDYIIKDYNVNVIRISGTVEERMEKIRSVIYG